MGTRARLWLPCVLMLGACSGTIEQASGDRGLADAPGGAGGQASAVAGGAGGVSGAQPPPGGIPGAPGVIGLGASGITRLSRAAYRGSVPSLPGFDLGSDVELLRADSITPFDNGYTLQAPSKALVEGLKPLRKRAVASVITEPALRSTLVGC